MMPTATDAACGMVCVSVCVLVTRVNCAKMTKLNEMPFRKMTYVGPRNHLLNRVEIPTGDNSILNNVTAAADCNTPDQSVSHYIVPREKSATCNAGFHQNSLTTCLE